MTNRKSLHPGSIRTLLLVMAGGLLTGSSATASDTQASQRLTIPLTAPAGLIGQPLRVEELSVRFDDRGQDAIRILRSDSAGTETSSESLWQVVVYFDTPLATPDGLRRAASLLGRASTTLTDLGPTQIVLADPWPRGLLEPTRDPQAVKEVLQDIRDEARNTGELLWHRQRFSAPETDSEPGYTTRALQYEIELIEQQRQNLLRWLARSDDPGPKLLILVQNGHDLNSGAYYSDTLAGSFFESPQDEVSQSLLARVTAAQGWTALCLSLGPRPLEFTDPTAPLFILARATGGGVVTSRREATRLLAKVSSWPFLQLEITAPAHAAVLPFEVRHQESGRALRTRQWASVGPPPLITELRQNPSLAEIEGTPVVQLLRPEGLALEGEIRLRTITGRQRIHDVAFLLDGEEVFRTEKTPFTALVDLGEGVRPHTITAIAFSRSGRSLGEDSVELNMALESARVVFEELSYDEIEGILDVAVRATAPLGSQPDRVEIYFNEKLRTSLSQPPYRARIGIRPLRREDYVRVLAHYPTGEIAEAARLPASAGHDDELEVNLVELLAMVTPRNRKTQVDLGRDDFVIRQQGRPLPIDQFSRWEELQLTLGLVLDTSDSMDDIIEDAREAGERFFDEALKPGDEAFVVDFNNLPRLARSTTGDSDRLLHSLVGLEARGMTALYDAIVFSLQQFENTTGRRALVVVTDGEDSASYYQPSECVRQARLHGVPVYLIVLGSPPDPSREPELLRNLMVARRSGGEIYYISDLDDLSRVYGQIISELRHQYFLAFNTGHTLTPAELEEIEIEVVPKGVSVRTLLASQQRGS